MSKNRKGGRKGNDDVAAYIAACPKEVQAQLTRIRRAIREVAPGAVETTSYFAMPGYSYPGYDYHGMFVWFSFKDPDIRLHLRPPTIENHARELAAYPRTKAIVSFPATGELPLPLVKRLVRASEHVMKDRARVAQSFRR